MSNFATLCQFCDHIRDLDRRGDTTMRDQTIRDAREYIDTRMPANARAWAEHQVDAAAAGLARPD